LRSAHHGIVKGDVVAVDEQQRLTVRNLIGLALAPRPKNSGRQEFHD
jgi:hypothetical protein